MATIFSRIVAGEIPCYKVAENDKFFVKWYGEFIEVKKTRFGYVTVLQY